MNFTIKIADIAVEANCLFSTTRDYCAEYLYSGEAEVCLSVTQEDIDLERKIHARTVLPSMNYTDAYLETLALQRKLADTLLQHNTILFHGSAVAVDGCGYLFTAVSGTGKSTHTRLWRAVFGSRAVMVNDDKPFLRIAQDNVLVCGSPWNGKHGLGRNVSVPLTAICLLERGRENSIREVPPKDFLQVLFQQSWRPNTPEKLGKYMELVDQLSKLVPFYRLSCNMDPQAAMISYTAMSRNKGEERNEN